MAVNLSAIKNELLPGLFAVTGKYDMLPKEWDKIFDTHQSKMAFERTTSMRFLGLPQLKAEGAAASFDNNAGERFLYTAEHIEIALGFAVTRRAIEDNLYKSQFNPSVLNLNESFAQAKEIYAANVLNSGWVYDPRVGGDGVALFSTAHPIDGQTIANTPTVQVDLNESSLINAQVVIGSTFRDNAGLLISAKPRKLIVPPALEPVAVRLTKTELRPGTGDNDVNAIRSVAGGLPDGYIVNHFLTNGAAWFVKTDKKGLIHYERRKYESSMDVDFTTQNLLVLATERYSFSYNDWRAIYGSAPTN